MACSEGGFRAGFSGRVSYSEGFRRRFRRSFERASGRASGRLRRVYRSGASGIRVTLRKAPKGSFGVARPEGVFEGVFREGLRKRSRRGLRRISERGASGWLRRGLPEGVVKGSSGGRCEGVFR